MSQTGWKIDWSDFEEKVVRRIASSKKGALPVLMDQAKQLIKAIVAITPPGNSQRDGLSKQAKAMGENKMYRDIVGRRKSDSRSGGIVSPINGQFIKRAKETKSGHKRLFLKGGFIYTAPADNLNQDASSLATLHESHFVNGKFRRAGPEVTTIGKERRFNTQLVAKTEFEKYIRERQKRVGYLMSGWAFAAAKLGLRLPAWVIDVRAPSAADVVVTADRIRIVATNNASFASNAIPDRRIQSAIDSRAASMQREWEDYVKKITK